MLDGLDLCTGGTAGLSVAVDPWITPLAYCEIDTDAQRVLLSRMGSGEIPAAPIWDNLRSLRGGFLPRVDAIVAGTPCQDVSVAGKQAGIDRSTRSGLLLDVVRLTDELEPGLVFLENVEGIKKHLPTVELAFRSIGYSIIGGFMSAWAAGAPHQRIRWFGLAYPDSERKLQPGGRFQKLRGRAGNGGQKISDAQGVGGQLGLAQLHAGQYTQQQAALMADAKHGGRKRWASIREGAGTIVPPDGWPDEPDFPRVAYGVSRRVDRVKHCGNAVAWFPARLAFITLCDIAGIRLLGT